MLSMQDMTIESITINGLAKDNAGNNVLLKIPRTEPLPAPKILEPPVGGKYDKDEVLEEIPEIPPAMSLPSAELTRAHLFVELGELLTTPVGVYTNDDHDDINDCSGQPIADPKASAVYRIHTQPLDGQPLTPSLVIKIASEQEGRNLALEAGMYQALECFQGNAIARMYGYFRAEINLRELRIKPWSGKEYNGQRGELDIFKMPNTAASLNIILLEELQPIPSRSLNDAQGQEMQTDLFRIAKVLADAGVDYTDWNSRRTLQRAPGGSRACH
ncbi:hypothetical protein C8Q79DRAFT_931099 [Trametes meyenii]|nr:hypothetical protein C8Q79DRAFT_931099 [Trametes meyenii]